MGARFVACVVAALHLLLLLLLPLHAVTYVAANRKNLTVGYLPNAQGRQTMRQGLIVSGAMSYAVHKVNEDPDLLPNHNLRFEWNDTYGLVVNSTRALTHMWRYKEVVAFFGPEDTCSVEATCAAAWNLPMISYKCADYMVSNKEIFSTFARTFPPDTQITKSVVTLLKYYQWKKFSIVHEDNPKWEKVANNLVALAKSFMLSINHREKYVKQSNCCEQGDICCNQPLPFAGIVDRTYQGTRIYVFLGDKNDLVTMMAIMRLKMLLDSGEYMVIYVDMEPFIQNEVLNYIWSTHYSDDLIEATSVDSLQTARSLLVVAASPPSNTNYSDFEDKVREYNEKEPFNFREPNFRGGIKRFITIYAAHLYDSVILYARALTQVFKENGTEYDGDKIIQNIIKMKRYMSIQGLEISIDSNGDAEGNYSVLALVHSDTAPLVVNNRTFNQYFAKVGSFQEKNNATIFSMDKDKTIMWLSGNPPLFEPPCGFNGSVCRPPPDHTREIVAGTLGSVLVTLVIVAIILYKNWKYEQEIAGLVWKIDIKELNFKGNGAIPSTSKLSLISQTSMESRGWLHTFAPTGTFRNTLVACKILQFSKKSIEISRDTMKEMRLMREVRHDNVNPFLGICIDNNVIHIVSEYCSKGSLPDILENDDLKLDNMFIASLIFDLVKGMIYLHDSDLKTHGNLKSPNCLVTSRWVLQVSDSSLHELRKQATKEHLEEYKFYQKQLWRAPESLRDDSFPMKGTQKADVYAFGIILHEIMVRQGPFGNVLESPKEIVYRVMCPNGDEYFRPDTTGLECQDYILNCMHDCWSERPESRPDFRHIRDRLKKMRQGMKSNIFDNMVVMMEKYANNLEVLVDERTAQLSEEKKKTESLLHRMLPQSVAAQLMRGEPVQPESFEAVTIYFSDIVGFTAMSAKSSPLEVVTFLNDLYTTFDAIIRNYDVYKVETIGDAYMVVSGLPIRNGNQHAGEIASMALELLASVHTFKIRHQPDQTLKLRIGIHTGPTVAGVVGITMPRYCLFGDTVNTSSRMESTGEALKIHISSPCRDHLEKLGGYIISERGVTPIKGKGGMTTYWLLGQTMDTQQIRPMVRDMTPPQSLFCRMPEWDARCRSPKMGTDSRSLSLIVRRNSSVPRVAADSEPALKDTVFGPVGVPKFLIAGGPVAIGGLTDSPRRRHLTPIRAGSFSHDQQRNGSANVDRSCQGSVESLTGSPSLCMSPSSENLPNTSNLCSCSQNNLDVCCNCSNSYLYNNNECHAFPILPSDKNDSSQENVNFCDEYKFPKLASDISRRGSQESPNNRVSFQNLNGSANNNAPDRFKQSAKTCVPGSSDSKDSLKIVSEHSKQSDTNQGGTLVGIYNQDSRPPPLLRNGCATPLRDDSDSTCVDVSAKGAQDDMVTPLLHLQPDGYKKNPARLKLNHCTDRKGAKRWRSCDEIDSKITKGSGIKCWVRGLFNGQDSSKLSNLAIGKGRNSLIITEHDSESVV